MLALVVLAVIVVVAVCLLVLNHQTRQAAVAARLSQLDECYEEARLADEKLSEFVRDLHRINRTALRRIRDATVNPEDVEQLRRVKPWKPSDG